MIMIRVKKEEGSLLGGGYYSCGLYVGELCLASGFALGVGIHNHDWCLHP